MSVEEYFKIAAQEERELRDLVADHASQLDAMVRHFDQGGDFAMSFSVSVAILDAAYSQKRADLSAKYVEERAEQLNDERETT